MKKQTIIHVLTSTEDVWASHHSVRANLLKSYQMMQSRNCVVKVSKQRNGTFGSKVWKDLLMANYNGESMTLVVLDCGVNLHEIAFWLKWLHPEKLKLRFHIHGDLLLRLAEWREILTSQKGHVGEIIVASDAMKKLATKWLGKQPIHVVPLPIDDVFFKPTPKRVKKVPATLSYFGRLNPDKGLGELLDLAPKLPLEISHFNFYGAYTEELHLSWLEPKQFRFEANKAFISLVAESRVELEKLKNPLAVKKAMEKSAATISLSTFMCEEFGLAVAQSLALGKKVYLSNWGGHRDFSRAPGVVMLPVNKRGERPMINVDKLPLVKFKNLGLTAKQQKSLKKWSKARFSIEAVADRLNKLTKAKKKFAKLPKVSSSLKADVKKIF